MKTQYVNDYAGFITHFSAVVIAVVKNIFDSKNSLEEILNALRVFVFKFNHLQPELIKVKNI